MQTIVMNNQKTKKLGYFLLRFRTIKNSMGKFFLDLSESVSASTV